MLIPASVFKNFRNQLS